MNKSILSWTLVLLSVLFISSCNNDDGTVLATDCYIRNFTLGNVKRVINSKTTSGNDTTYLVSYAAGYYPMVIDQVAGTIENKDSLLVNSLVSAILVNIESSGTVVYRKIDRENEWNEYSKSDSIDFTSPLVFRVYTADNSIWRDYAVKLNVHQQDGDVLQWQQLATVSAWSSAQAMKMFVFKGRVWNLCKAGQDTGLYSTAVDDGRNWTEEAWLDIPSADVNTLVEWDDKLYLCDENGGLFISDNAVDWTRVDADRLVKVFAADCSGMYALSGTDICKSADGRVWTVENLDAGADFLPVRDITAVAYEQDQRVNRILMLGCRDENEYLDDKHAMVWSNSGGSTWTYFNVSEKNNYACPRLTSSVLFRYGDLLLLMGNGAEDAAIYVSQDNGITWKTDVFYVLPNEIKGRQEVMSAAVDTDQFIWMIVGGEIWRGRLNKYGFQS